MKNLFKTTLTIVLLIVTFSCSKDEDPQPENPKVTNVYAGGYEYDTATNTNIATIWKDGVAQHLPTVSGQTGSYVKSISVDDNNNVFAVGYIYPNSSLVNAVLWKNGVKTTLSQNNSAANSVYLINGKPYILGYDNNLPTLWFDGTSVSLGSAGGNAYSIFIKNNDIYVSGRNSAGAALLWKNNGSLTQPVFTETILPNGSYGFSVFVSDNIVYVAGYDANTNQGRLWKNGVSTELFGDHTSMRSVFVKGQNTYIAGINNSAFNAMLWTNGNATTLSQNISYAFSVFATATDVYVAGSDENACIWKNGTIQKLSSGASQAETVFVTEK